MIYGYPLKEVNEHGLLEMREICFDLPSDALRDVAKFLAEMARVIEAGEFDTTHMHIQSVVPTWDKKFPQEDIVVSLPDDSGEAIPRVSL